MMRHLLAVCLMAITLFSCKKSSDDNPPYKCATCTTTPEAQAAHDASSKGIYKGVLIGSSGTISFNIANNGNTITAVMVIDGTTVNLTSNVTWVAGTAYIAPFTGSMGGQTVTINFSVDQTGLNPMVTSSSIPGHPNAIFTIVKESSTSLVEAFQGTYTKPSSGGTETGTFNMLLAKPLNKFRVLSRKTGSSSASEPFEGSYSNGVLSYTYSSGAGTGTLTGSVNGDVVSGTLVDGYGNGSFSGQRTL